MKRATATKVSSVFPGVEGGKNLGSPLKFRIPSSVSTLLWLRGKKIRITVFDSEVGFWKMRLQRN